MLNPYENEFVSTPAELAEEQASVETQVLAHQRPDGVLGEWELVAKEDRNIHQKIAAETHGIVTAANVVSLAGAAFTGLGLRNIAKGNEGRAVVQIGFGRVLDLVDGMVSTRFKTRGKVGAGVDAGLDKALTAGAAIVMTKTGAMSKTYTAATVVEQGRIAAENLKIEKLGGEPNPSESGKKGMGALWLGVGARVIERMLDKRGHIKAAEMMGVVAMVAEVSALDLTEDAASGYRKQRRALQAK